MDTILYTGDLTSDSAFASEQIPDAFKEIGLKKPCNIGPKYVVDLDNVFDEQMYGQGALIAYRRDDQDLTQLLKDKYYLCRVFCKADFGKPGKIQVCELKNELEMQLVRFKCNPSFVQVYDKVEDAANVYIF